MSTSPMNKKTEITDNGLPKVLSQIITDNVYFLKQRHRVPQTSIANAMHIYKLEGRVDDVLEVKPRRIGPRIRRAEGA